MNISRTTFLAVPFLLSAFAAAAAEAPSQTPAIAGVVRAGTPIELVKDDFESVEGPLPQADSGVLFSNARANRIHRIAPDGTLSVWYEGTGGANGLTVTPKGEIAATLIDRRAVAIVKPGAEPRVLVDSVDGAPFHRPNDVVASQRGDLYFSDMPAAPATGPLVPPSSVYRLTAKGELSRVIGTIARPNGVALSPDERTLYVANTAGEWIYSFPLDRDGKPGAPREFARLVMPPPAETAAATAAAGSGADGIAIDDQGRLFVATTVGVQVFSPKGEPLGIIVLPKSPQNLAFSGPGKGTLYVVGRGAVYRIATQTHGPRRAGK